MFDTGYYNYYLDKYRIVIIDMILLSTRLIIINIIILMVGFFAFRYSVLHHLQMIIS